MFWIIFSLLICSPASQAEVKVPAEMKQKFHEATTAVAESYREARTRTDENPVGLWVHRKIYSLGGYLKRQMVNGISYLDRQLHAHVELPEVNREEK